MSKEPSIEELQKLLVEKKQEKRNELKEKICSFSPLKKGASPCEKDSVVFYGEKGYCSSHKNTQQAKQAKDSFEKTSVSQEKEREQEEKKTLIEKNRSLSEDKNKIDDEKKSVLTDKQKLEEEKKRLENDLLEKERLLKEKEELLKKKESETPKILKDNTIKEGKNGKLRLKLNSYGRWMDSTGYVFSKEGICYGKQLTNGSCAALMSEDLVILKKRGILYSLPDDSDDEVSEGEEQSEEEEQSGEEDDDKEYSGGDSSDEEEDEDGEGDEVSSEESE